MLRIDNTPHTGGSVESEPEINEDRLLYRKITFIGPFRHDKNLPVVSRCHPDQRSPGCSKLSVAGIHSDTTVVDEYYESLTEALHFIKLLDLGAYPLPDRYFLPYNQVKYCEVRHFMLDISKIFHFLAELPALKKLIIGHDAICTGNLDLSGRDQELYLSRSCPSLEKACVMVNSCFHGESAERKKFIEKRVQKIVEMLVRTAPNIQYAELKVPGEIDLSGYYNQFPDGVQFVGLARPPPSTPATPEPHGPNLFPGIDQFQEIPVDPRRPCPRSRRRERRVSISSESYKRSSSSPASPPPDWSPPRAVDFAHAQAASDNEKAKTAKSKGSEVQPIQHRQDLGHNSHDNIAGTSDVSSEDDDIQIVEEIPLDPRLYRRDRAPGAPMTLAVPPPSPTPPIRGYGQGHGHDRRGREREDERLDSDGSSSSMRARVGVVGGLKREKMRAWGARSPEPVRRSDDNGNGSSNWAGNGQPRSFSKRSRF